MLVGMTAVLDWCAWHRGLYVALINRQLRTGSTICLLSMLTMFIVKAIIGGGTAPIRISLTAAIIGAAIPLSLTLVVKATERLCLVKTKFGTPVLKFLNQPIVFRYRA